MAKQSALDVKLAEIDHQIAQMEADLDKWKGMRDFLKRGTVTNGAEKPKRKLRMKRGMPPPPAPATGVGSYEEI